MPVMQAIFTRSPVIVRQQLPGQTAKTSELCMWPSGQRARWTRNMKVPRSGPDPGGVTWVFFGRICAARDCKLAPRSK